MTTLEGVRLVAFVAVTVASLSCGKKGSGGSTTTPTGPGTSNSRACRTYFTRANVRTTTSAANFVFSALEVASFDESTRKATIQTSFANGAPCSTNVVSYASAADFVNEVRVIPPVMLSINAVNTNSGSCGSVTATTSYVYDSQRRVVQITNGTNAVTTYTAWDSSGRPTAGTSGNDTLSLVYDDTARTLTTTQKPPTGEQSVSTLSFDQNGNPTQIVLVQGNVTTTTTFTTTATATACG